MSNDEQAWYAAAEAEAEPAVATRFRVGAADPVGESSWTAPEAFQQADAAPQLAGRAVRGRDEPATTLGSFERGEPAQPVEGAPAPPRITARTLGRSEPPPAARPSERTPTEPLAARTKVGTAAVPGNRITARPAAVDTSGKAGTGFQVDPAQYQAAASSMLAVSEQVGSLYSSLSSYLPALESQHPWGNDESGKQFAEGEKGYLKYSKDTLDVVKGLPAALKGIADGLKAMADGYQNADEGVVTALNGVDPGNAPMPASPQLPSHAPMRIIPPSYHSTPSHQSGRH
ncbi:hypothetical protein [Kitasatospora sp. NPDC004531]